MAITNSTVQEAVAGRRSELRSRQIVDAAVALMQRQDSASVSMQSIAKEVGVSVGLLYKYFPDKEAILLAAIGEVLNDFGEQVPQALTDADDPLVRVIKAFESYCAVVDQRRHAVVLTYRVSRSLSRQGLQEVMDREVRTLEPLRTAVEEAVAQNLLQPADPHLFAHNLLLLAHSWALKHWYHEARGVDLTDYVRVQVANIIAPVVPAEIRETYRRHWT